MYCVITSSILLWVCFLLWKVRSQIVEAEVGYKRTMKFIFPRDGDDVLLTCYNEMGLCPGSIIVAAYFTDLLSLDTPRDYLLRFSLYNVESNVTATNSTEPILSFKIDFSLGKHALEIPFQFQVEDVTSGEVLFKSDPLKLIAVHPSDFGVAMLTPTAHLPSTSSSIDFIELGTSNFDTATQAAASLLSSGLVSSVSGVAVEAVVQYLAALPVLEGCHKINAALSVSEFEQLLPVYYLPESIIDKVHLGHYNKGCSSVGTIDTHIITQVLYGTVPAAAVMKAYVPALTISKLLTLAVQPDQGLRLLKTDMEGMDQPVLHQMLDFYENRTQSAYITSVHPCVVYFETKIGGQDGRDSALFDRFQQAGYMFYELTDDEGYLSYSDAMAVNCLCNREDFAIALSLLIPNEFDVDTVLSVC